MKPFNFRLQKVLNLRKFYEDEAKIELGRAVGVVAELESRLNSIARERARAAGAQFAPGNSAAMIQQYMFYLLRLENNEKELLKEKLLAEQIADEAREAFIEASRERKVLDNLKEKRHDEYIKMKLDSETRVLDDISSGVLARIAITA